MNRSNVGNVVTNGMQILSVGATTASRVFNLGKANQALNSMGQEQSEMHGAKLANINAKTENVNLKNSKLKSKMNKPIIDDFLTNIDGSYSDNSEQINDIKTKVTRDNDFINQWKKSISNEEPLEKLIKNAKGGDKDAND